MKVKNNVNDFFSAWLKHTFPFDLLSESDSFLFNDSTPETPSTNLGTPSSTALRSPSSVGSSSLGSPCSVTLGTPSSGGLKSSTDSRTSTWRSSPKLSSPKFKAINGHGRRNQDLNGSVGKFLNDSNKGHVPVSQTGIEIGYGNQLTVTNKANLKKTINNESKGKDIVESQKSPLINGNVNLEETGGFSVHSVLDSDRKTSQANGSRTQVMKTKTDKLSSKKVAPCEKCGFKMLNLVKVHLSLGICCEKCTANSLVGLL